MRAIFGFLTSTPVILCLVTAILSVCIWFFGPAIGFGESRPLETALVRGIVIGVLVALTIITILILLLRRRGREKALTEEIAEEEVDPTDAEVAGELAEMRRRMKEALSQLKKGRGSKKQPLYQLPWYIIIGPPGAGKTTAIVNSGLKFPLAESMGPGALGGVGGTRNCDWWFTDDAVLIDTAGRYTTQESDREQDRRGWEGFLGILKKHRPRQPINGALVAISLSDLSVMDERGRKGHAVEIRKRLQELRERLGVRFPVYVLFTKADLIAGFQDFFEPLGKEDRAQIWGFTLPLEDKRSSGPGMGGFDDGFAGLMARLNEQALERMRDEDDPGRRSLVAGFPMQVASLRSVAKEFLGEVFAPSRYAEDQLLRGIYFTSGTQEGTPIDRLLYGMAETFGIGRQAIGTGQGKGRSYFLQRLMTDVVFREAGLVSADDRVERRY